MGHKRLIGLLGAVAFLVAAGAPSAASASTKTLLDALRKATLGRPLASILSIHTTGRVELVGLKGTIQEWDDLRGQRFTSSQEAGALSGSSGWDDKAAWNQDYAGLVSVDGGSAGRLQAIDQAYLDNLSYLRPDAGGATVIYAGQRADGGKTYDVLAVTPPQGSELDLWIDPRTHLIGRETGSIGIVSQTTILSEYRRINGITYPFSIASQASTGNSETVKLSSLEVNSEIATRMRMPQSSVHDFAIAGVKATVPLQIINNHIYLNVMLDGRGPYTFILDSGGDYIVTPEVAATLQAKSSGGLRLSGVGNATEGAAFTRIDSIAIGNAVVHNQYMLVLPIATGFGVAEGLRIDGMVGYQFIARFLTTIDYAGFKLTLAMPGSPPNPEAAKIPFFFDGTIPRIPITIGSVATTAEVDTGSRGALTLSSPFVQAYPAIAALAKTPPAVEGFGVGGASYARLGRVPSFQIGPYVISNSVAAFGIQAQGAMADPFNPVNVGGTILRRFDVTFDYRNQLMYLSKNADFGGPFSYDRSGLFLIDANGAYTVLSVLPGAPGAAAGLEKGDVILNVNATPVANGSLAGLRQLLSGPVGTVVHLHVRTAGGAQRDLTLTLADYV